MKAQFSKEGFRIIPEQVLHIDRRLMCGAGIWDGVPCFVFDYWKAALAGCFDTCLNLENHETVRVFYLRGMESEILDGAEVLLIWQRDDGSMHYRLYSMEQYEAVANGDLELEVS